jgi:hypothetical protein
MISDNDFDRLIELGSRKGRLDIDDIKEMMPVETMTTEDLAGLVILLEEHGIAIELDPELLMPGNWPPPPTPEPLFIPSEGKRAFEPPASSTQRSESIADDVPHVEAHGEAETGGFSIDLFIYAMAGGLVLFLLAWAAWGYLIR